METRERARFYIGDEYFNRDVMPEAPTTDKYTDCACDAATCHHPKKNMQPVRNGGRYMTLKNIRMHTHTYTHTYIYSWGKEVLLGPVGMTGCHLPYTDIYMHVCMGVCI